MYKNNAFDYTFTKLTRGFVFDEVVVEFLSNNNIPHHGFTTPVLNPWLKDKSIITKNITEPLSCEFADFRKFYYYEIISRGNLASAK